MILLDLVLFNDYNSEKQREIIADIMQAVNDTVMFWCKLSGGTNTRFLVGMNTIATKMFLLMYDPMINPKLDECRGTFTQPISVNKEFLSLVNEYNTLLMEYNQYLNIQRYNTEYLSIVKPRADPNTDGKPATNVSSLSNSAQNVATQQHNTVDEPITQDIDEGYISSDDDSFAGFNIDSVIR